ncbi:MAG: hypothetical protein CW341_00915 [Bacteroidetes bacterium]|nr:hypothetical protein [Bacteroidota bacterium]
MPLIVAITVNCQLATVNYQLSTVNYQLSTVNCQLSTVNCQLSNQSNTSVAFEVIAIYVFVFQAIDIYAWRSIF